ncbi:DUF1194 domain-containing protein [Luteolibacter soli]|uniref:DUF1194 domain-containing protein n=1 Tax=Luteolibacter soli TaxID=3135280 RepID=A0ABU9AR23_9BACT
MKTATLPGGRLRLTRSVLGALCMGAAVLGVPQQVTAESVDSELLLMVDSTQRGLNNRDFDALMDSYADAFSSASVMNSIQSGSYGRIAVSLVFFGNANTQVVGIPWMSIGSAAEAQTFADILRAINRPASPGSIQIDSALLAAIPLFGTETGAGSNGYESTAQIVEFAAASTPAGNSTAGVAAARNQALASGVDVINSIAVGNQAGNIASYFTNNVIGGQTGGVVASSSSSALNGNLSTFLSSQVSGQVGAGAAASLSAVPEPSPLLALVFGFGLLCLRRQRIVG